jgi:DNA-binding transcriptional LysR family regulator
VCYHHAQEPIELDPAAYEYKVLGMEKFLPYSVAKFIPQDRHNNSEKQPLEPLYALEPGVGSLPFLLYSRHAYLSRMFDLAWQAGPPLPYHAVLETDMSESLRAMCAAGLGIAWLPSSVVGNTSTLVPLPGPYNTTMEVRLYRRRPSVGQLEPGYLAAVWHQWPCGPLLASMVA